MELCPVCRAHLFERGVRSPPVRLCQECWWADQRKRHKDGAEVHPLARFLIENPPKKRQGNTWTVPT